MSLFNKKPGSTPVDSAARQPSIGIQVEAENLGGSLEQDATSIGAIREEQQVNPAQLRAEKIRFRRRAFRYGTLTLLAIVAIVIVAMRLSTPPSKTLGSVSDRYSAQSIPLGSIGSGSTSGITSGGSVSVNGQLNVNNGLVLAPIKQPANAVAGQLFYNQTTNQLSYYNGKTFEALAVGSNVVSSFGGAKGDITLGNGLGFVNNKLSYTGNGGVLSLQGETGNVSLTAGGGVAIDGTTISSTGVLALGGQNGNIAVGPGLSVAGGTLKNSGVLSVNGGSNVTVTTDGNGNVTISTAGAGTGTVSSPGGTAGTFAVFDGVQDIADSLLSQSGGVVTVAGGLTVQGNLTLNTALTVASGGTGATNASNARTNLGAAASGANTDITSLSGLTTALTVAQGGIGVGTLATNGVLIGNGTSPISAVNGTAGECLVATAGAPVFQACPGTGGVTSVNGLSGTLSIANSTAAGSTITLNDATTAAKGIASFNASNFLVAGGVVNTIQDISVTATPTFAGLSLNTPLGVASGGTGSNSAAGARTNLGAAGSGANTDITSLGGLTTALSTGQGGTGANNAADARSNLGAAASGANSDITSLSGLTTALSVIQGGTGAASLTANGVLLGNGTGAITAVAAGGTGQCLVSTAGAPVWQTCPGSGGVASVNGLTGAITINNATAAGSSITINDAKANGSTKGIAAFNSANFTDNGAGVINTIQGIAKTDTPSFTGVILSGNSANAATLAVVPLAGSVTYTLPDPGSGSATICLNTGNCAGTGGGVTNGGTNGTANTVALFTGGNTIGDSIITQSSGTIAIGGDLSVTGTISGNGSGLTSVNAAQLGGHGSSYYTNASNINSGTLDDSYLSTNVALLNGNNDFTGTTLQHNGNDVCDASGNCVGQGAGNAIGGGGTVNTFAIFTDTGYKIGDSILSQDSGNGGITVSGDLAVTGDLSASNLSGNGSGVTDVDASKLNGQSGSYYTNASNINAGTLDDSYLSGNVTVQGNDFNGANELLMLNGSGYLPALNGSLLTNVDAAKLGGQAGSYYTNASNINAGTIGDTYLSANVTVQGNTFNGVGQLVRLDGTTGYLPALNGSALTGLNGSNISSGTIDNTYLTGSGALSVTAGTGLTGGGSVALGGTTTLAVSYGAAAGTAVQGNVTLTCAGGSGPNLSGGGSTITLGSGGSCGDISMTTTPSFSNVTLGDTSSIAGSITLHDGSTAHSAILQLEGALTGDVTYNLPNDLTGTQTICTVESGNCAGSGSGVTASGTHTQNYVSKFGAGGSSVTNSSIYDDGTGVSVGSSSPAGLFNVGGTNQFQVSSTGAVTAVGINSGAGLIQGSAGLTVGGTVTLSDLSGGAGQCLTTDGSGVIGLTDCLSGGGGGSGGVASLNGLSGTLSINNASGSGSTITINNGKADGATKGIVAFNATNFTDNGSGIINTVQDISTTSDVSFNSVTLATALSILNGGTGATTAAGALSNLGAAASGANTDITSLSGLTTALSVAQGGTGASTFTANGVLIGNGTSAITAIAAGSAGQCLVSTAGAPEWDTCPGSGGVAKLNGLSGTLSIANATAAGTTITINDGKADGATKGIVAFNATNFTDNGSGIVNTVQDIDSSATPAFNGIVLSGTGVNQGTLKIAGTLSSSISYELPTASADQTLCTVESGNCAGVGGGVTTTGGDNLTLAMFTGGNSIADSIISQDSGGSTVTITGDLSVTGTISGNGSGVTNVDASKLGGNDGSYYTNASNISSGTLDDSHLSNNVALLNGNNDFTGTTLQHNGNDVCDASGNCVGQSAGDAIGGGGTANKIALFTGTGYKIGDSILSQDSGASTVTVSGDLAVTGDITTTTGTITAANLAGNGSAVTDVDASKLGGNDGSYYTNASNINAGTLDDSYLSANVTLQGNTFNTASHLVKLDASNQLPAVSGALVTNLNGSNVSSGTIDNAYLTGSGTLSVTAGNGLTGGGSVALGGTTTLSVNPAVGGCITSAAAGVSVTDNCVNAAKLGGNDSAYYTNASNINAGTLDDSYLSTNVTVQGNTFNGIGQLVQLDATNGYLPVLNGSLLTSLNGSSISSGTVGAAYGGTGVNGTTATAGQILIGKTGGGYALATITATDGITVTNGSGTISLAVDSTVCRTAPSNCSAAGAAGGDLSGSYPNPTVAGIQNTPVTFTSIATGDVLQYNGTNIVNGHITNANLTAGTFGSITGTGALTAGSIASGFGTISTTNNITTTANIQGTNITANEFVAADTATASDVVFQATLNGTPTATINAGGQATFIGVNALDFSGRSGTATDHLFSAYLNTDENAFIQADGTIQGTAINATTINATSGYKFNSTDGATTTCTAGNVLQNTVIQGGIITGGTCVANGGNYAPSLQDVYNNSGSTPVIALTALGKGMFIQDAATSVGGNLFAVQSAGGGSTYFGVTTGGFASNGTGTADILRANAFDAANAGPLNLGLTIGGNATSIALNQNVTVANGKTFTANGSGFDAGGNLGVGTTTPGANIDVQSTATSGNAVNITANGLTAGNALNISSTLSDSTTANSISASQSGTFTTNASVAGSLLDLNRNFTANAPGSTGITYDSQHTVSGTTTTWSHTVPNQANRLLLVQCAALGGGAPTGMTFDGINMSLVASANYISVWKLVNPPVGTYNIVASSNCSYAVSSNWHNVDQTSGVGTYVTKNGSAPLSTTISSATNQVVVSSAAVNGYTSDAGSGAGQTVISDSTYDLHSSYKAGASSVTMSENWGGTSGGMVLITLLPSTTVTTDISGALANLSSNCTVTSGACADTSNILNLGQNYSGATGTVLNIQNAGSGDFLDAVNGSGTTLASINSAGLLTTNAGVVINAGGTFTNAGSTLNSALALSDFAANGALGTAAATVDTHTAFTIPQTTAGITLTLPNPTVTTAGRLIYIANTGSASISIAGVTLGAGTNGSFFWNGSAWASTAVSTGVTIVGAFDSQAANGNGAVISGNTVYFQSASASNPGMVNTIGQTFKGAKTFSDLLTGNGGLTVTGAVNLNTTGTANTNIGNSTGTTTITGHFNTATVGASNSNGFNIGNMLKSSCDSFGDCSLTLSNGSGGGQSIYLESDSGSAITQITSSGLDIESNGGNHGYDFLLHSTRASDPAPLAIFMQGATPTATANMLQLENSSSTVLGGFNYQGNFFYKSGSYTSTLVQGALSQSQTITLPASSAPTDQICLKTLNNCASSPGVQTVGTYSTTNTAADGATISGSTITFQSASINAPGMVDTGTQSFKGDKTFTNNVAVQGSFTANGSGFDTSGNLGIGTTTPGANIDVQSGATSGNAVNITAGGLTTGNGLNIVNTSGATTSGNTVNISDTATVTSPKAQSGSELNINRSLTTNAGTVPQIALDSMTTASTGSRGALSWSHTVGNGSNSYLVVTAGYGSGSITGITYNGVAMTQLTGTIWGLANPTPGTHTVVISANAYIVASASSWFNVDPANPIGTTVSFGSSSGSIASSSTDMIIDSMSAGYPSLSSPGSGQTQMANGCANTVVCAGSSYKQGTAGTTSMSEGSNSGSYSIISLQWAGSGSTVAITGAAANIQSNCTVVVGSCDDSSNILNLNQQFTGATGTVLNIQNAGTGDMLNLVDGSGVVLGGFNSTGQLFYKSGSYTSTLVQGTLSQNQTITLPASTAPTDQICLLTLNNCASSPGVQTVGTYSTSNTAANGATISGSTITFQSASINAPGMVDTQAQTLKGAKTFNDLITAGGGLTATGTTNVNTSGSASTTIGNALSTLTVNASNFGLSSSGVLTLTGGQVGGDITTSTADTAKAITIQGGTSSGTGAAGGSVNIEAGAGDARGWINIGDNGYSNINIGSAGTATNITGGVIRLSGSVSTGATNSLVTIGNGSIAGGNNAVNGGTYLGLNAPSSGTGSAADFLNFQLNGVSKVKIDNSGDITAAGTITADLSTTTGSTLVCQNASNQLADCDSSFKVPTGTSFILNQTSPQANANFNIQGGASSSPVAKIDIGSGTGDILQVGDGALTGFTVDNAGMNNFYGDAFFNGYASFAQGIDSTAAGALNIGYTSGGNATSIALNQDTTIASGKTLTVNGLATFNSQVVVGNYGTSTAQLYVGGGSPTYVGTSTGLTLSGASDMKIVGRYAYVVSGSNIDVFDLAQGTTPVYIGQNSDGNVSGGYMAVVGHYIYVTNSSTGKLLVYDISNVIPSYVGQNSDGNLSSPSYIIASGHFVYIYDSINIFSYDVSGIIPKYKGKNSDSKLNGVSFRQGMSTYNGNLYVLDGTNDFVDIYNITSGIPVYASQTAIPNGDDPTYSKIAGHYLYIGTYSDNKIYVYDISGATPSLYGTGTAGDSNAVFTMTVAGNRLYTTDWGFKVTAYDISNIVPSLIGQNSDSNLAVAYSAGAYKNYFYAINTFGGSGILTYDTAGSTYTQSLQAGSTQLGSLSVDTDAAIGGNLNIQGDLGADAAFLNTLTVSGAGTFNSTVSASGLLTANGGVTIAAGKNFVNGGSTLYSAKALSLGASGAIGTAAATVNGYTTFDITATATSLAFTIPSPTVATSGRIIYINNVGTNDFAIGSVDISAGASSSFIWNGTSWTSTAVSTGVSLIGAIDTQSANGNGATIVGNTLYLQSASGSTPGLINGNAQTFAGNKTFSNNVTVNGAFNVAASISNEFNIGDMVKSDCSTYLFSRCELDLSVYDTGSGNTPSITLFDNQGNAGISTNGKLGVNNADPQASLDVIGSTSLTGALTQSGTSFSLTGTGTSSLSAGGSLSLTAAGSSKFTTTSGDLTLGTNALTGRVVLQALGSSGVISIGDNTAPTITIGNTSNTTRTVSIANGNTSTNATVNIGSMGTVNIGATGSAAYSNTTNINNTTSGTGTQAVNIGSSANAANSLTLEAGNTGKIQIGNGATAHTIAIGSGAGTEMITVGSITGGSTTTIQGGTGGVGVNGLLTANSGLSIAAGQNFVNGGSTLNASKALSLGTSGAIGTAAATVDAYTTFDITATATSLTFSLPSPTVATSGRIVYINNVGTNTFSIGSVTINAGASSSFIWNGTSWTSTAVSTGVSLIGALDGQTANANGATIVGNTLYLQSANGATPGLVNGNAQTFNGDKTFAGNVIGQSTLQIQGTGNSYIAGNLGIGTSTPSSNLQVQNSAPVNVSLTTSSAPSLGSAFSTINFQSQNTSNTTWSQVYSPSEAAVGAMLYDSTTDSLYAGAGYSIYRCPASTGCASAGNWTNVYTPGGSNYIESIVEDSYTGTLFATNYSGYVLRCSLSTGCDTAADWAAYNSAGGYRLGLDSVHHVLYITNNGNLRRCDLTTNCDAAADWTTISINVASYPLLFDATSGIMYTAGSTFNFSCDTSTGCASAGNWTQSTVTGREPQVMDASGYLYSYGTSGAVIYKCAASTGCNTSANWSTLYTLPQNIASLYFDSSSNTLYAGTNASGAARIYSCSLSGDCTSAANWDLSYQSSVTDIFSFAKDTSRNYLYAGSAFGGTPSTIFRNGGYIPSNVNYAQINASATNSLSGSETGALTFNTLNGGSSVETLRLQGGKVAIGNTAPAALFSVGSSSQFQIDINGNAQTSGTLTIGGLVTANGGITIGSGKNFVNGGSTLNSAKVLSLGASGTIGTAATTVDAYTTFNVTATAASLTFTLPNPTVTTAGRIVYINNVGTNSFVINGATLSSGASANFIWNGTAWTTTAVSTGVSLVGTYSTSNTNANGATISGNTITFQSASASAPGMVDTGSQSFTGSKSFATTSSTAFRIQTAGGSSTLLTADTSAGRISIGSIGTPTGQLYVSGTVPTYFGQNSDSNLDAGENVAIAGHYAYVAGGTELVAYDISSGIPVYVGENSDSNLSQAEYVAIVGHYAYVVDKGNNKLVAYDISSGIPVYVGENSDSVLGGGIYSVAISGRYAYVPSLTWKKLFVYDISSGIPVYVGENSDSNLSGPERVTISGHDAYVADSDKLAVYDISSGIPVYVGENSDSNLNGATTVAISGRYAYVTSYSSNKLVAYDISSGIPVYVGENSDSNLNLPFDVAIAGHYAYVVGEYTSSNKLAIYDISSGIPVYVGENSDSNLGGSDSMAISGRYAYVVSWSGKLVAYDLGGTYSQTLETGSLEAGIANISGALTAGSANILGSLAAGDASVQNNAGIGGNLGVGGNVTIGNNENPTGQLYVSGSANATAADSLALTDTTGQVGITSGDYTYVASATTLTVYNTSDPLNIKALGSATFYGSSIGANQMRVVGHYLYAVADGNYLIYDVANPNTPTLVGYDTGDDYAGLDVKGKYMYLVSDTGKDLEIYDVSNPSAPQFVGGADLPNYGQDVVVRGGYAYVADDGAGLLVYDVSNPASPIQVGQANIGQQLFTIAVQGHYAYLKNSNDGIHIDSFDISDPTAPTLLDPMGTTGNHNSSGLTAETFVVSGRYLYAESPGDTLNIYDISDPSDMSLVDSIGSGEALLGVRGRYALVLNYSTQTIKSYDLGGTYTQQLQAGNTETGTLHVDTDATVGGSLNVQGGLGASSINAGSIGTSQLTVAGNTPILPSNLLGATSLNFSDYDDGDDNNVILGSQFTTGASAATANYLNVYIGAVSSTPDNEYQMAIYSDASGAPGSLLATSQPGVITPNSWNSIPIPATALSASTAYWVVVNVNGASTDLYWTGGSCSSVWANSDFSSGFPSTFTAGGTFSDCISAFASATPVVGNYNVFQIQDANGIGIAAASTQLNTFGMGQMSAPNVASTASVDKPTVTTAGTAGSTSYSYEVLASACGSSTPIGEGSVVATIATGNATLNGTNYNKISWTEPDYMNCIGLYYVYRTASGGSPNSLGLIGMTAATTFNDTGVAANVAAIPPTTNSLPASTTYYYEVTALDGAGGETTPSSAVNTTTGTTGRAITLTWFTIDGARGYKIYRASSYNGTFEYLGSTTDTTFTDDGTGTTLANTPPEMNTAYQVQLGGENSQLSIGTGTSQGQVYVGGLLPSTPLASLVNPDAAPAGYIAGSAFYKGYWYTYQPNGHGFYVVDVSNPSQPKYIPTGNLTVRSNMVVVGHYLYYGSDGQFGDPSFGIMDLSNPTSPVTVGTWNSGDTTTYGAIAIQGHYAYISNGTNIEVLDTTNPANPTLVSNYTGLDIADIDIQNHYLYAVSYVSTGNVLQVFDISNPKSLAIVGGLAASTASNGMYDAQGVTVNGHYLYISGYDDGSSTSYGWVVDATDPTAPRLANTIPIGNNPGQMTVSGNRLYVQDGYGHEITVDDITNPSNPLWLGTMANGVVPSSFTIQGRYLYLTPGDYNDPTYYIYDLGGTYTQQLQSGNTQTSTLTVDSDAQVGGNLDVQGGLTASSAEIQGDAGVSGNLNVTGTVHIGTLGVATGQLYVSGTVPTYVGQNSDSNLNTPQAVAISGHYAYVTSWNTDKLVAYDISSGTPVYVGQNSDSTLNGPTYVAISGHYAYVTSANGNKLVAYDISSGTPVYVGQNSDSNLSGPQAVAISGHYAYVPSLSSKKLVVYDISSGTPVYVGQNSDSNLTGPQTVAISGHYAYVASFGSDQLVSYDISSGTPVYVGQNSDSNLDGPQTVVVSGHYAYVTSYNNNELVAYDISSGTPVYVGENSDSNLNGPNAITIAGHYAYVTNITSDKLAAYDISSGTPVYVGQNSDSNLNFPAMLAISGHYAYVASSSTDKLVSYDLGGSYIQLLKSDNVSTSAVQIQAADGTGLFNADAASGTITFGNPASGNYISFTSAGGLVASGTARHMKTIALTPEYAGAVLNALNDPTCASANNGTMTSGFDATARQNYYDWTSTTAGQCYDIVVQVPIPRDFGGWASDGDGYALNASVYSSTTAANSINLAMLDTNGTLILSYSDITPGSTNTWSTFYGSGTSLTGTYTPGGYITLAVRLTSPAGGDIRIGNISLNYYSKF